jgi:hypothetical protein
LLIKQVFEQFCGFWPQRTNSFLPALSEEACMVWPIELQITGSKIQDFLNPSACIKHGCQEQVVSAAICSLTFDARKYGLDFGKLQILHRPGARSLKRHTQDSLALLEFLGVAAAEEAKETVDPSEADIAGRRDIVAIIFKVLEKVHHQLRSDILHFKHGHVLALPGRDKAEEQFETVTITVKSVRTYSA